MITTPKMCECAKDLGCPQDATVAENERFIEGLLGYLAKYPKDHSVFYGEDKMIYCLPPCDMAKDLVPEHYMTVGRLEKLLSESRRHHSPRIGPERRLGPVFYDVDEFTCLTVYFLRIQMCPRSCAQVQERRAKSQRTE